MKKKNTISLIIVFVLILAIVFAINYILSFRTVSLEATNISNIEINAGSKNKQVNPASKSFRVKKGLSYSVQAKGADGYADISTEINPDTQDLKLNPDYSQERLDQILRDEKQSIVDSINSFDNRYLQIYSINTETVLNLGKWYFATLAYGGDTETQSADSLAIGLIKESDSWQVVAPPEIIFLEDNYPDLDKDFMTKLNDYKLDNTEPTYPTE